MSTNIQLPGLGEIAANVRGLLEAAELLFEHGRYSRAAALAVLAIEEVGKYFMVKWREVQARRKSDSRRHDDKQQIIGTFGLAEAACQVALSSKNLYFEMWLEMIREAKRPEDWEQTRAGQQLIKIVADALESASLQPRTRDALEGNLSRIKNEGFYVDLDENGHVRNAPTKIDKDCASEYLAYARSAISRLR